MANAHTPIRLDQSFAACTSKERQIAKLATRDRERFGQETDERNIIDESLMKL